MKTYRANVPFKFNGIDYEADITARFSVDANYGADLDGHNGRYTEFLEDWIVEDIWEKKTLKSVPLTKEMEIPLEDAIFDFEDWTDEDSE